METISSFMLAHVRACHKMVCTKLGGRGGLRILEHLNFGLADKGHRPVLPSLFCLAGNGEIEMLIDLPVVV